MHEVKVYDHSGKLEKVISIKALDIRLNKQLEAPLMFRKNRKGQLPWSKAPKSPANTRTL